MMFIDSWRACNRSASSPAANCKDRATATAMAVVALAALALVCAAPVLVGDAMAQTDERVRYDLDGLESQVQDVVDDAVDMYRQQGTLAFGEITPEDAVRTGEIKPFVMDADTLEVVAHGAVPGLRGQLPAQALQNADMTVQQIREELAQDGASIWINHIDENPAINQNQEKRTLLQRHGDYIFAAGYYLHDAEVQQFVERHLQQYVSNPDITMFTPEDDVITNDLYLFVIDEEEWTRAADGVRPGRVGMSETILDTSASTPDDVLAELRVNGATWVTYTFNNPATDINQLKRTWLVLHDGYLFGSGYYPHDSRDKSLVDSAIITYSAYGNATFDIITPAEADPLSTQSTFVLDADTLEVVAHARLPERVGATYADLDDADRPRQAIIEELHAGEADGTGVWIWHMVQNPSTLTDQLTHTYLVFHDGYVFGAGTSLPDIRAQSLIDETLYTYRNDPDAGFDVINSGALNRIDLYPVARNATHIAAHGTVPGLVGPFPDVQIARSGGANDFDALQEGDSQWSQFAFFNTYTGITQIKRTWTVIHDGYLFAAPYTVADADTQSVTDYARLIYDSNKENDAWINIITPDAPVVTNDLYPFVVDLESWTRVADGVVPDRLGMNETILETSGRTLEDVRADLEENGRTWLTYTFHNPATGVEQLKRTYLQLRDGLVFGSGYYLLDSQVQAVVFDTRLKYDATGRQAVLDSISMVPDEPVSTYLFAVDPHADTTLAQGVDPELIGGITDWTAITAEITAERILDDIDNSINKGIWVSYTHKEPVTGELETKRTWLALYDGIIFGSGYYTSDIPASDAKFVVRNAILTYDANKDDGAWVHMITPDEPLVTDALYPFVIHAESWTRAADGVVPARLGMNETILNNSGHTVEGVLAELEQKGSIWISYSFHNPATGIEQLKRSYLQLHDGYVFGSGYYILDSRVQATTHGRILEYEQAGYDQTISSIGKIPDEPFSTYAFVVNPDTDRTLAQNVDPELIGGITDWESITSVLDKDDIIDVINRGTGMWVSYLHTEPITGERETKRTWLVLHDGIIFGSGYYTSDIPAFDARFAVSNAIRTYEANQQNDAWIDIITADAPVTTDALYVFVIHVDTWTRAADGVLPARLGMSETILDTSTWTPEAVIAELEENGSMWVSYTFHNPATGVEQLKRSYLQLRDGYIFGSGYYILDSGVQAAAQSRILEYERDGRDGIIASVGMIPDEPSSTYAFIVDPLTKRTLAQNVDPNLIGDITDWDAITEVIPADGLIDMISRGTGTWVSYTHTEPVTGEREIKRTWLVMHGGIIFGSGYYTSDIPAFDAKFVVRNTIQTYETYKADDEWVGIITPDEPLVTDALYPFVIDFEKWTRAADGVLPARLGMSETILDNSGRTVDGVRAELEEKGAIWVSYTFHNPATGIEQLKRSYLQLHDGYVFGAGYYILDSRVQAATHGLILEYERDGRDAAIASVDRVPDEPSSTYVFVVDPDNDKTLAQNVDLRLIGGVRDWDAIVDVLDEENDILDVIRRGTGTWVSYTHTEPVTGNVETKHTWLVMHDGLVIGSGHYASDVPAFDAQFAVSNAIRTYEANQQNDAWIDIITADAPVTTDALYVFVIHVDTWTRAADGVLPARLGMSETILDTSTWTPETVIAELEENGSMWVSYTFHNPATGVEQLKRSYLQLRDGYIFGSGYYLLDSQVQAAAQSRILEYIRDGLADTVASVNAASGTPSSTYAFMVDPGTDRTLAQGVDTGLIGGVRDWDAITDVVPRTGILDILERGNGIWLSYMHTEPVTGELETKRTWLIMHDGIIFGAGYYTSDIQEADVASVVRNAIHIYEANRQGDAWIDVITPDEDITTDALYIFVIDADEWTRAADGVRPGRVGTPETILVRSDRTQEDVLADLRQNGTTWASYIFLNPATGIEQSKRSYLQLHEGYIFGSGYYILDSRAQAAVQGRVLEYERDGRDDVVASVNRVPAEVSATYPFIVDSGTGQTLAQGVTSDAITTSDWAAIASEHSAEDILDIIRRGTGLWVHYEHTDPATGMQETKRTWLVMHDNLVFGAGYYESDILVVTSIRPITDPGEPTTGSAQQAQDAVAARISDYMSQGRAALSAYVNAVPSLPSPSYVYIVDPNTLDPADARHEWNAIISQHPDILDRLSGASTMMDVAAPVPVSAATTIAQITPAVLDAQSALGPTLVQMRPGGGDGIEACYVFENSVGELEIKRAWIQMYDGLVFFSSYEVESCGADTPSGNDDGRGARVCR